MSRSAAATPFVARVGERAEFAAAVRRAASGEPGLVLLAGDAGVGKTRLLGEVARDAASAGARVVVGHCVDLFGVDDGDVGVPYLPFTEALGQLVEQITLTLLFSLDYQRILGHEGDVRHVVFQVMMLVAPHLRPDSQLIAERLAKRYLAP